MKTESRLSPWWWRCATRARARVLVILRNGGGLVGVPCGASWHNRLIDTEGGTRLLHVREVSEVVLDDEVVVRAVR